MIDDAGYLSIIDFGFAKKIPFLSVENGTMNVKMKSYTLCGTPGWKIVCFALYVVLAMEISMCKHLFCISTDYLAPEFIFNSGVTHSVDLWALGVIMHEMIMLMTPFRPTRKADLTSLFINIASVKVSYFSSLYISCVR